MTPFARTSDQKRETLRVMFVITSMPVGGAETLLVNLIRRLDKDRFTAELCCLKTLGPLGQQLATEFPAHHGQLTGKYDIRVLPRLVRLFRSRKIDAVVTVGAGDKMFWGRLAARIARVPVVISALHSTGWPDGISRLNRCLTRWTDAFVGVAKSHSQHLIENERFPAHKVHMIPNGVDIDRFAPVPWSEKLRHDLGLPLAAPVIGIVAALRPEKNHSLFLRAAARILVDVPETRFLVVGDGPERQSLTTLAKELGIESSVHFLGNRHDIAAIVGMIDVFALSSHNEAQPVSILEAMACAKPVVATHVGSIPDAIRDGVNGYLVPPGDVSQLAKSLLDLVQNPLLAREMGAAGRVQVIDSWSLQTMANGYQKLISRIHTAKLAAAGGVDTRDPDDAQAVH